ncbi:MAG: hypothetical protein AAB865_01690 [Patescibacteria group bacterium]
MSNTPNYDAKVKVILDALQSGERVCVLTGEKWTMTDEEIGWCKKFNVPPSKYSPLARWRILAGFGSAAQYWNNKDPRTGKTMIAASHPSSGVKVIPDADWYASDFSNITRDDDPSRSVFATIRELETSVPFMAFRNTVPPVNSIAAVSLGDENSYFVLASRSKNSCFGINAVDVEDSVEISQGNNISQSFNVSHSIRIFNSTVVMESQDCMNCQFIFDCRNCENCFMATNKRNKRFVFCNEQLTEDEYRRRMSEIDLTCRSTFLKWRDELYRRVREEAVWPENFNDQAENSSGEYLTRVTNCRDCFTNVSGCHDQYRCAFTFDDTYENAYCFGVYSGANNVYGSCLSPRSSQIRFSYLSVQSQNLEYCIHCYNCENCFGCVGLQRKKFCIFNKQYTEDEYWKKLDEIKCRMLDAGEYGEYFPLSMSPMCFLDSGAAQYMLADAEDAKQLGAQSFEPESNGAAGEDLSGTVMKHSSDIPDCLADFKSEEWVGKPVFDDHMQRRFTFLPQEIAFYQKMKLPPPAGHFIGRIQDLGWRVNSGEFIEGSCKQCQKALTVSRNKTFPERGVYCREHYLKFIEQYG